MGNTFTKNTKDERKEEDWLIVNKKVKIMPDKNTIQDNYDDALKKQIESEADEMACLEKKSLKKTKRNKKKEKRIEKRNKKITKYVTNKVDDYSE